MAGGSNQEVQDRGMVSVFFLFSLCASPRVCMFVNAAVKRKDEPREAWGGRGGLCTRRQVWVVPCSNWAQRRPAAIMHAGAFRGEISSVLGDKVRAH